MNEKLAATLRVFYRCVRKTPKKDGVAEFQGANQVLQGQLKKLRQGLDISKHKSVINEDDIQKMYSTHTLSDDNSISLQHKFFFELALHFGRRGQEGWHNLKKQSFALKTDANGRQYVTIVHQELDKNHRQDETKTQVMFEQPDSPRRPVHSFTLYLSKLHPELDDFLQRLDPLYKTKPYWYVKSPLGVLQLEI